jgi:hypothetical protein
MFSFFGSVAGEGGGTLLLEGSHRLLARYMAEQDGPIPGNSVTWARFLRHYPELRDLWRGGSVESPGRGLLGTSIDVEGIALRPIELVGEPGDMYLAAFHIFHTSAPNVTGTPRQMLSTTAQAYAAQSHSQDPATTTDAPTQAAERTVPGYP